MEPQEHLGSGDRPSHAAGTVPPVDLTTWRAAHPLPRAPPLANALSRFQVKATSSEQCLGICFLLLPEKFLQNYRPGTTHMARSLGPCRGRTGLCQSGVQAGWGQASSRMPTLRAQFKDANCWSEASVPGASATLCHVIP